MSRLRPIDRFQVVTTALFIGLGIAIVVRAALLRAPVLAYVIGGAFAAYGLYRARFIVRALQGRGTGR